jgi:hypothetical protein
MDREQRTPWLLARNVRAYQADRILRFIEEGMTIYDVGAHAGYYTLFFPG